MRQASWFVCLVALLASSAHAQDEIHWQPTLETAQQLAAKTNRLVLIHFWAPWCQPCMNMDKNVFAQPETGPALDANFVLVKLNADDSRATARIYQVTTLPTDVIVTPSGRLIAAIPSPPKPQQYIAQMNQAADAYKRQMAQGSAGGATRASAPHNPYGAVQVSTAPAAAQNPEPPASPYAPPAAAAATTVQPQASIPPGGVQTALPSYQRPVENSQISNGQGGPAGPPPVAAPGYSAAMAGVQPPAAAAPAGTGDALDGFCCVTLVDQKRWLKGDVHFGAIHRGRVYKFVSQEAQQRFLANPDAFSPVMQGNDPVLALEARQAVPGSRKHGLFYQNRIYLFSSEESLLRFQATPSRYAAEVTQASR